MPRQLSADEVRLARIRAQGLLRDQPDPPRPVADVVRDVVAIQAQDMRAAELSIRSRGAGFTVADVRHARDVERSITRVWCMRGTLHLIASDDLGWLGSLLFPVFAAGSRPRRLRLGLHDDAAARGVRELRALLAANGPTPRSLLREQLASRDVPVEGQAFPHLMQLATCEGIVCFGPDAGNEPTFVLREDWLGPLPAPPREQALAELARRYLRAYGPAGPADLAAWSGLPLSQARVGWRAIAAELLEVTADGQPAWVLASVASLLDVAPPAAPSVCLAAAFDTYLLGYKGRALSVAPEHAARVLPGGGMLRPTLLVNGRAAATWSLTRRPRGAELVVEPYEQLPDVVQPGLEAETADIGRFLVTPTTMALRPPR